MDCKTIFFWKTFSPTPRGGFFLFSYRMAYGNEVGLVVVDIVQKTILLNMCTPNLYGSSDPYQRVPRSPKRTSDNPDDRCRSPSADQVQTPVL